MSIIGAWDVTINTPFGAQVVNLEFTDEQTGVARFRNDSVPLRHVSVTGNTATCSVSITDPMSIKLRCTVEIDGDAMSGTASAGFFGRFALTGNRTTTV